MEMNIIRNSVKGAAVLFGAALVMAGCQRDGLADGVDSGDGQIRYSVKVAGGVKGALINTSGDDDLPLPADSSFFVSAYKGSEAQFENKKATSKDGGTWTNDDPQYWPLSTKLAFFAYANTTAENIAMNAERTADTLVYTVPADASQHQDILLGYGYGDGGNRGVAEIRFEHPLTAVLFKEGTVSGDIKSITLSGLASGGKVAMTKGAIGEWTVGETEKYETVVTLSGGEDPLDVEDGTDLIGTDAEGNYNGAFLLVPQKLAESDGGHPATVTVFLTTADGDVTVTADIDSGQWGKGKTNTYTLNYGSATGFALSITEWNSETYPVVLEEENPDLLPGKFSVSETEYVQFTRGNLYCTYKGEGATPRYEFSLEDEQYQFHGRGGSRYFRSWRGATVFNPNPNSWLDEEFYQKVNDSERDLGYPVPGLLDKGDNSKSGLFQWNKSNAVAGSDYGAFSTVSPDIDGSLDDKIDWGDAYGNGTTSMTANDWVYLTVIRDDNLRRWSEVNGVPGVVLAPDNSSVTIEESYTEAEWHAAENQYSLVFIPAAGMMLPELYSDEYRHKTTFYWVGVEATMKLYYWSADGIHTTERSSTWPSVTDPTRMFSCVAYVKDSGLVVGLENAHNRSRCMPVRLVKRFSKE